MSASAVDLAVSFVLYNTAVEEVERVVSRVLQSRLTLRIHLIDNSPTPISLPGLDDERIVRVNSGRNLGYGAAHNIAIRAERGRSRHHAVLNTDIDFEGHVLDELVEFLDSHPGVGMVAPKIVYPDCSPQYLCRLLPGPLDIVARRLVPRSKWGRRRNRYYEFRDWTYDEVADFPSLSGCFMVIRSDVLAVVDGFDERFFLYFEDFDLSRRINAVARTQFVPVGPVTHEYRSRRGITPRTAAHLATGAARYFSKWGWFVDPGRDAANRAALGQFERRGQV